MIKPINILRVTYVPKHHRRSTKQFRVDLQGDTEDDRYEAWLDFAQAAEHLIELKEQLRLAAENGTQGGGLIGNR